MTIVIINERIMKAFWCFLMNSLQRLQIIFNVAVRPGFEMGVIVPLMWDAAVDWSFEDEEADTDVLL